MRELESWEDELQSVYLYRILETVDVAEQRRRLFHQLAAAAQGQAEAWAAIARDKGVAVPVHYHPPFRVRLVGWLLRRFGPQRMLHILAAMKVRGLSVYTNPRHPMSEGHPEPQPGEAEKRHLGLTGGGNLRAAIFGVNDGLVSNASLILGVAGAALDAHSIFLTGLAGLLAGAASMAAGEYISVRSQREMFEYQIGLEREELKTYPEEEAQELALIYEARGLGKEQAQRLAHSILKDEDRALDALAREELGLNPDELGSPWGAATSSFMAFAVGALVPLFPYLIGASSQVLYVSIGLTLAALLCVGAATSLFTGRSAWMSGLRMMLIGSLAGAATYFIGHLFGTGVV